MGHGLFIGFQSLACRIVPREVRRTRSPRLGQSSPQVGIAGDPLHGVRKRIHLSGVDEQSRSARDLRERPTGRGDNRASSRHGFQHGQAKPFVLGGVDKCRRAAVKTPKFLIRDVRKVSDSLAFALAVSIDRFASSQQSRGDER